jgi:hypothetical protein
MGEQLDIATMKTWSGLQHNAYSSKSIAGADVSDSATALTMNLRVPSLTGMLLKQLEFC